MVFGSNLHLTQVLQSFHHEQKVWFANLHSLLTPGLFSYTYIFLWHLKVEIFCHCYIHMLTQIAMNLHMGQCPTNIFIFVLIYNCQCLCVRLVHYFLPVPIINQLKLLHTKGVNIHWYTGVYQDTDHKICIWYCAKLILLCCDTHLPLQTQTVGELQGQYCKIPSFFVQCCMRYLWKCLHQRHRRILCVSYLTNCTVIHVSYP